MQLLSSQFYFAVLASQELSPRSLLATMRTTKAARPFRAGCWTTSVAQFLTLKLYGYNPNLWIGWKIEESQFYPAHAWVECDGIECDDSRSKIYKKFSMPLVCGTQN